MARISCTQQLWRRLGHAGRPPRDVVEPRMDGVVLGSWAATVCRPAGRDLVIALNERTYLTVVFPLAPRRHFHWQFACAAAHVLVDLGVPPDIVRSESAAIQVEPLARLADPGLKETLNDLAFFCGLELLYHEDMRVVQLNLNEIPHQHRIPYVPIQAVHQLFGARLSHAKRRHESVSVIGAGAGAGALARPWRRKPESRWLA